MAYKRKLVIERKQDKADEEEPQEVGWRDWLLRRYAQYWYWVGAIFLDIIIFLEVQRSLHLDVMLALMLAILAAVVELYVYARIWGRHGPLREKDIEENEE